MTPIHNDGKLQESTQTGPWMSRGQQLQVVASMYVGYAMFMVLRMAPTVAGTSITGDPSLGIDTGDWGRILAMGTVGAVVGKFIGGWSADRLGGRLTFAVGLVVSALGVAAFAASRSVWMFQAAFFVALMAKSAGWPSMTKIIGESFRANEYGRVWGVLATSSRVGTLVATFCLGGLLSILSWQFMLYVASLTGVVIAVGFLKALKSPIQGAADVAGLSGTTQPADASESAHPLDQTSLPMALKYFFASRQFWLITGSLMGLTILWDFLLMVPLFLRDTLDLSVSSASMASSAFPFGSLFSVLVGGFVFDKLSRRATAWLMAFLLSIAAACILAFYAMPTLGLSEQAAVNLSMALLFTFGLCVSPCYYIPMSVFSIEFGGPHSGFLVALLDAIAFGATACFYFFAGEVANSSWSSFLAVLLAVAVWSLLTTFWFMLGEARRQEAPA